jgi:hypothetical protein
LFILEQVGWQKFEESPDSVFSTPGSTLVMHTPAGVFPSEVFSLFNTINE